MPQKYLRFSLRFFLVASALAAIAIVFGWERYRAPVPIRDAATLIGPMTTGDVEILDDLILNPEMALKAIHRSISRNERLSENYPESPIVSNLKITPMEMQVEQPRDYPLIGLAQIRKRDFHCRFSVRDKHGNVEDMILIFNRNHFHQPDNYY